MQVSEMPVYGHASHPSQDVEIGSLYGQLLLIRRTNPLILTV